MANLLQDKNVVIVVMAPSYTSLHRRLTSQGGHNCSSVNKKTDYVVSNGFQCDELRRAKQLGIRIITELEFEGLLAGKPLDDDATAHEEGEERFSTIEDAFGRVRSVFASRADASVKWFLLIEELDSCDPERREELVTYIESAMDHAAQHHPFDGIFGQEGEQMPEARVMGSMPQVWCEAMAAGDRDIKYRLVREVDMFYSGMSATFLTSLLKHKDVHRIERVRFMQNARPSKTMLKTLFQHRNTSNLAHLALGGMNASVVGVMMEYAVKVMALRTLDLSSLNYKYTELGEPIDARMKFLHAPFFSTIETVVMPPLADYIGSNWLLDTLTDVESFAHLRELSFYASNQNLLTHLRDDVLPHQGVQQRITHLRVRIGGFRPYEVDAQLRALFEAEVHGVLEHVTLIDRDTPQISAPVQDAITRTLLEVIPGSVLLSGLQVFELGGWATPDIRRLLSEAHPDLEVR